MHIAWLGKKSPFCGNVTYGREITNGLLERDYQVSFLHFAQKETHHPVFQHGWEVSLPCLYKSQVYTIPSLNSRKVLTESLARLKPDLVHASLTLSFLDFRLPEICQGLNIPLVATFHPAFDSQLRTLRSATQYLTYQLYAPALARYDRVIVFSYLQQDLLVKLGVPAEKLAVIPNGVDSQKYSPGKSKFKAKIGAEQLFVYQGRISAEKNIPALLKGWKEANLGETCKLVMVGDGTLLPSLMPLYGQAEGVIWLGIVGDEQRRIEILRAADGFILPSFVEGLSLSLLEAMACGVACIATDAGADGEVLDQGAGVVINPQQVTVQLKEVLQNFRDQPEKMQRLGHKARERVLERYTLERNLTQLEGVYQELAVRHQVIDGLG
jgi:glycosyltransferase involved in cell wall biosynthesis